MPIIEPNPSKRMCPLLREACCDVCHTCEFWDYIRGIDRNTGKEIDQWMCLFKQQRLLALENSACMRDAAGETEAMRNEFAKRMDQHMRGTVQMINMAAQIGRAQQPQTLLPATEN